jgi:hypothetical protein
MKDAMGHGSDGRGGSQPTFGKRTPASGPSNMPARGGSNLRAPIQGNSSNADAARALMGALKSTQAPVHPAMAAGSDRAAPGPRPDITEALQQRSYAGTTNFGDSNWGRALKKSGR